MAIEWGVITGQNLPMDREKKTIHVAGEAGVKKPGKNMQTFLDRLRMMKP